MDVPSGWSSQVIPDVFASGERRGWGLIATQQWSDLVCQRPRVAGRQQGFTLIELLVAMTLVVLLMTLVYEGLRSGQKAAETGQAFIDRTNRLRITHEFVRMQVGRLMPLAYKQDPTNGKLFLFEGDHEKIRFVAPMPGYLGFGGTYVQELELIRDGRFRSLVFRHWLHNGFDEKKIDKSEPPILLLSGIGNGGFRFKGVNPEGKLGDWTERWEDPQLTPMSIQLDLEMSPESRIDWPLLEIVMMVDGGATRGFNAGFLPSG
jgi:general secretion pathway protein J